MDTVWIPLTSRSGSTPELASMHDAMMLGRPLLRTQLQERRTNLSGRIVPRGSKIRVQVQPPRCPRQCLHDWIRLDRVDIDRVHYLIIRIA